jgi:haloalkane dehalogenase
MERDLDVGEGRLRVDDAGDGPLVLCVHGTPTYSYEWRHVVAALRPAYRVVTVDHLGFGYSERPPGADYSPEAHSRRFRQLMSMLAPSGPVTLVVHDFGGPIALDWALDHADRLQRLVVVNSWMWPFDDDPQMQRRARLVSGRVGRWLYRHLNASLRLVMPSAYGNRRALTAEIHQQYLQRFPDADSRERVLFALARSLVGSQAFFRTLWDRRAALATVPVDICWGMRDSAFQPPMLSQWRRAVPHARVREFPAAGHWPHEEDPDGFVAALRTLLST